MTRKPPYNPRRAGTLFEPRGASLDWPEPMLRTLEVCARQALTAAETARRVGCDVNALGRGGLILIHKYQTGRPVP
jgi:hypothetical protein